jgi:hypothetical protein
MQGKYPMLTPKNKTPSSVTPAPLFIKTSITLFFSESGFNWKKRKRMEKVFHEPTEAARTDGPESEGEKTASIASSVHRVGFSSSVLTARLTQPRAREDRTASALGFSLLAPAAPGISRASHPPMPKPGH